MAKWLHNLSGEDKTYHNTLIEDQSYFQIPDNLEIEYKTNSELLADIANNLVKMSTNGTSDLEGSPSEHIDFLKGIDSSPKDTDGSNIIRTKAAKAGWTYHMTAIEAETSKINSFYHKDISGNNLTEASVKYYDNNNQELTTQQDCDTSCTKTVITFEPTWDYEIIGGTMKTIAAVTNDIRVWVVAVPDVAAQYGGSKVMVQNVNLRFIDPNNGIVTDGRAAKYMTYSATYHTNKLQFTLKHDAGIKEKIMVALEVFRA